MTFNGYQEDGHTLLAEMDRQEACLSLFILASAVLLKKLV